MKNIIKPVALLLLTFSLTQCGSDKKPHDRDDADDMFSRICNLTDSYTDKVAAAEDSAAWARVCIEYEDSLNKISFSYPPDTDLLLTEGQNDTIDVMMREYVLTRDRRINEIRYPETPADSLDVDSIQADASRSLDN